MSPKRKPVPPPSSEKPRHDFTRDSGLLRTEEGGRSWQIGVSFLCRCGAVARPVPGGGTYYFSKTGEEIDGKGECPG